MIKVMDTYYKDMKEEIGIAEQEDNKQDDQKLDDVIKQLRPNTAAHNFKHFLGRRDQNINKS